MIITVCFIYILGIFRDNSLQHESDISKALNYFQELNDKGKLSDVEFRIIKEQFSELIKDEIKNKEKRISQLSSKNKDAFSLLLHTIDNSALQDTQVIGHSNVCNNKNGQAEYIETETKQMKEQNEVHKIE
ncbi:MAG: hypothetical protein LBE18_06395 [Planctomycetaceae bacterium]|jgi:hypothetical protein|nr:hypothetical protein [Planctomycetaceae bacterium]